LVWDAGGEQEEGKSCTFSEKGKSRGKGNGRKFSYGENVENGERKAKVRV
jgi:hypothetical protein